MLSENFQAEWWMGGREARTKPRVWMRGPACSPMSVSGGGGIGTGPVIPKPGCPPPTLLPYQELGLRLLAGEGGAPTKDPLLSQAWPIPLVLTQPNADFVFTA